MQWRAAAHHHLPAYGVLAQFPPEVVRRAIGEAASSGDVLLLEELLNASRSAYTNMGCGVTAGTRRTPLHCAAAHGHADCVQLLLRNGRAEMSATCEGGRTAMHLAAMGGSTRHAACIRLLLRYGVGWDQPDLRGLSPVDLARGALARMRALTRRRVRGLLAAYGPGAGSPRSSSRRMAWRWVSGPMAGCALSLAGRGGSVVLDHAGAGAGGGRRGAGLVVHGAPDRRTCCSHPRGTVVRGREPEVSPDGEMSTSSAAVEGLPTCELRAIIDHRKMHLPASGCIR